MKNTCDFQFFINISFIINFTIKFVFIYISISSLVLQFNAVKYAVLILK